ncbi:MAG TPA: 16S rRNA (guanine(527)-N(7))-methyltransferase RsmG [Geobacteraceae bacterium]
MTPQDLLIAGADELGLTLTVHQREQFSLLAAELQKWNRKINLTAIDRLDAIVVKHFLDSLTLAPVVPVRGRLLDIGSGGGFPAIPLKILYPELTVASVDAVAKKIIFQRHAARLLGLTDFTALHVRGEALAEQYAGSFDRVVSRAFADLPTFVRLALPLISEHGVIIAMKGKEGASEAATAAPLLAELGVTLQEVREFPLPQSGDGRSLVLMVRKGS